VRFLLRFVDDQSATDDIRTSGADVKRIFKGVTIFVEYDSILKLKDRLWAVYLVHWGGSED
jgi:hypothetical protein